jgi:hypothetical protein
VKSTAVLFSTHTLNELVVNRFRKLSNEAPYDCFLLLDYTDPSETLRQTLPAIEREFVVTTFTLDHLKRNFRLFRYEPRVIVGMRMGRKPLLIPGNNHFPIISFLLDNNYEFVWNIEYDVVFSGNWREFFCRHQESKADLLTADIQSRSDCIDWYWWKYLESGKAGDVRHLRSFNPLYRLSLPGAQQIAVSSAEGWYGHHECAMPSIIGSSDLILEDFGGSGRYVRSENSHQWYQQHTYNHDAVAWDSPNSDASQLYHPVKAACRFDRESEHAGL